MILQYETYNAAEGKPVRIEPSDGTCGATSSRSTIMRPLDMFRWPNMVSWYFYLLYSKFHMQHCLVLFESAKNTQI